MIRIRCHEDVVCPRCGSLQTGRRVYVKSDDDATLARDSAYKKGELIYPVYLPERIDNNNYRCSCGMQWPAQPKAVWLTKEEIRRRQRQKGIDSNTIYFNKNRLLINRQETSAAKKYRLLTRLIYKLMYSLEKLFRM